MAVTPPSSGLDEQQLLSVLVALKNGDFSARLPTGPAGTSGQIVQTLNGIQEQLETFASESNRVTREIGEERRFGCQLVVPGLSGSWSEMGDGINSLARNLTDQVRDIAATTTAIAMGDLEKKVTVDAKGEILELKTTMNIMIGQLNTLISECNQISREVGTEGRLGGQAEVAGVSGCWSELMSNLNAMFANVTYQIRDFSHTAHALVRADASCKVSVPAAGETADLKDALNTLVDQLNE
jgi:HAMP domain-containing protein